MAVSLTIIPAFSPPQLPSGRLPSNGGTVVVTPDEHVMTIAAPNGAAARDIRRAFQRRILMPISGPYSSSTPEMGPRSLRAQGDQRIHASGASGRQPAGQPRHGEQPDADAGESRRI